MVDVSQWSEFGALAIVIGALFTVLITGFKIFMKFIEKQHHDYKDLTIKAREQHSQDMKHIHEQHKNERTEWGKESDKRDARYEASMRDFREAIKELRDKI